MSNYRENDHSSANCFFFKFRLFFCLLSGRKELPFIRNMSQNLTHCNIVSKGKNKKNGHNSAKYYSFAKIE